MPLELVNRCAICRKQITAFRDTFSEKEYYISGTCQACQDELFGVDPFADIEIDPSTLPTCDKDEPDPFVDEETLIPSTPTTKLLTRIDDLLEEWHLQETPEETILEQIKALVME
jgi:hypothetical protein